MLIHSLSACSGSARVNPALSLRDGANGPAIASTAGKPSNPGWYHNLRALTIETRAGVLGFTRSLSRELGDYGITANLITPGLTVTRAVKDSFPDALLNAERTSRALHRDETADDLVGPVFLLASEATGFVTGQTLNVDGAQ